MREVTRVASCGNAILQDIYGGGGVDFETFAKTSGTPFADCFPRELRALAELQEQGLVELGSLGFNLTPLLGRLLVRVVAAVFDAYLPPEAWHPDLAAGAASKIG